MPLDREFDPVTRDFIRDGKGGFKRTSTAATSVTNQLEAHLGECWHDEGLGSRLHDLKALQADPAALAAEEARRALGVLEEAGRIANVQIKASEPAGGRVRVDTKFQDRSTSQVVTTHVKSGG